MAIKAPYPPSPYPPKGPYEITYHFKDLFFGNHNKEPFTVEGLGFSVSLRLPAVKVLGNCVRLKGESTLNPKVKVQGLGLRV